MNVLDWSKNMLKDEEAQKLLEEKVEILVNLYFSGKSEYATEKFIKSFGEGLIYLESTLLKDRGIHPSQIQSNIEYLKAHPEETAKKMQEVKNALMNEINRQFRHFNTFLSEVVSTH